MLVNEAIKVIMEEHDIADQYDMAEALGCSQATISNYVKGGTDPRKVVAARIWGKYGLRVEPYTQDAVQKEWDFLVAHNLTGE